MKTCSAEKENVVLTDNTMLAHQRNRDGCYAKEECFFAVVGLVF